MLANIHGVETKSHNMQEFILNVVYKRTSYKPGDVAEFTITSKADPSKNPAPFVTKYMPIV